MKSEKVIREILEQYKFDYEITQYHIDNANKNNELIKLDAIIGILSWVLSK